MKITLKDNKNGIISVQKKYSHKDTTGLGGNWDTTENLNKIYRVDGYYIYMNANSLPLNVFKDKTEMITFFQEKGEVTLE